MIGRVCQALEPFWLALLVRPVLDARTPSRSVGLTLFGMDDRDFITGAVEDDGVGSFMTDYADKGVTLRICPIPKAVSDLSVPYEIDDFVDHGLGTPRTTRAAFNPGKL